MVACKDKTALRSIPFSSGMNQISFDTKIGATMAWNGKSSTQWWHESKYCVNALTVKAREFPDRLINIISTMLYSLADCRGRMAIPEIININIKRAFNVLPHPKNKVF